jgi:hypothetical protein
MSQNNTVGTKRQLITGWIAVGLVTLVASLWAYWGGIENFHEGWYYPGFWDNVAMMLAQYWLFPLVFMAIGLVGIYFRKINLGLCIALGIAAGIMFAGAHFTVVWLMMTIPFAGIGLLYFFGRPRPRWLATAITVGLPVLILLTTTVIGGVRVSKRINDGDFGTREVMTAAGEVYIWAPRGPGWPEGGVSYEEAKDMCSHLSEDGTELLDEEVNIWRLPSVEEAVACQMLHGENAGGVWDDDAKKASYDMTPDKETPLWDPNSNVIYYWAETMADDDDAYIIVYHGGVYTRRVTSHYGYLSFRAVKEGK